jgi:hypothetical protein
VNGNFADWERAIIHGRSTAVVLHLLNRVLADFEDGIVGKLSRRKILAAERKKCDEVLVFDEVNRLILKWADIVPD